MLKVTKLELEEVLVLEYPKKEDYRAISSRSFSKRELDQIGIKTEYDDTDISINFNILNPILSDKDKFAPTLRNSDCNL